MSNEPDRDLIAYCDANNIKYKKYPNCFAKKKRKSTKNLPPKNSKIVDDLSTSTLSSESSIDGNFDGSDDDDETTRDTRPTAYFDLIPAKTEDFQSPRPQTNGWSASASFNAVGVGPTNHINVTKPIALNETVNLSEASDDTTESDGPVLGTTIKIKLAADPSQCRSEITSSRVKCKCGRTFKSSTTRRVHQARECEL